MWFVACLLTLHWCCFIALYNCSSLWPPHSHVFISALALLCLLWICQDLLVFHCSCFLFGFRCHLLHARHSCFGACFAFLNVVRFACSYGNSISFGYFTSLLPLVIIAFVLNHTAREQVWPLHYIVVDGVLLHLVYHCAITGALVCVPQCHYFVPLFLWTLFLC